VRPAIDKHEIRALFGKCIPYPLSALAARRVTLRLRVFRASHQLGLAQSRHMPPKEGQIPLLTSLGPGARSHSRPRPIVFQGVPWSRQKSRSVSQATAPRRRALQSCGVSAMGAFQGVQENLWRAAQAKPSHDASPEQRCGRPWRRFLGAGTAMQTAAWHRAPRFHPQDVPILSAPADATARRQHGEASARAPQSRCGKRKCDD
jgi:hypothetical protein